MKNKNVIGLIICGSIFTLGFVINGNLGLYFNLSGLMIVFSGTLGASLLSFRAEQLKIVARVMWSSYRKPVKKESDIINLQNKEVVKGLSIGQTRYFDAVINKADGTSYRERQKVKRIK